MDGPQNVSLLIHLLKYGHMYKAIIQAVFGCICMYSGSEITAKTAINYFFHMLQPVVNSPE